MNPTVRREEPRDGAAVRRINEEAFGSGLEAAIVESLRNAPDAVSLVATLEDQVVGHILFTPITLEPVKPGIRLAALGPMAVRPDLQRQGIGTCLVRAGLHACAGMGYAAIVVVGHPHFYPRFGFGPASARGLRCEFPVPDDVFLVLELEAGALQGVSGLVRYLPEFSE